MRPLLHNRQLLEQLTVLVDLLARGQAHMVQAIGYWECQAYASGIYHVPGPAAAAVRRMFTSLTQ
jgi:hypothetical protein